MHQGSSSDLGGTCRPAGHLAGWKRFFPVLARTRDYRLSHLYSDTLAGVVVAVLLIPQGMAYALLAGLPPQVGLYASLLPVLVYPLFGTSRFLAVGPVAMV
jgi:SulP family sulfate permease